MMNCEYGKKIEEKNRRYFSHPEQAFMLGLKSCRACFNTTDITNKKTGELKKKPIKEAEETPTPTK